MMCRIRFALFSVFLLVALVAAPFSAHAERESYYAPPSQVLSGILLGYSEAFSQDYVNLNPNPLARFTAATAGFHFNNDKNSIANLRVSINAGSLTSPDKDFTWILIGNSGLNVSKYDEIVLFATEPAAFDKQNKATIDGFMTLRGITMPVKIESHLNYIQDTNLITGTVLGEKGTIGISLTVNFKCADFGMTPVDNNNKSRGDLASLKVEMRALKQ